MVEALRRRKFFVDQVRVYWMFQGDPQYAFFPTGTNDDIEITLGPRDQRTVAQDEGTRLGFVRSITESEDSRTL